MAATTLTRSEMTALVIPEALSDWSAQASGGQAEPVPGEVVPAADASGRYPRLGLVASGDAVDGEDLDVVTQSAGYAPSAGFRWRQTGDSATQWRGWRVPSSSVGVEFVDWTTSDTKRYSHQIVSQAGTLITAFQYTTAGTRSVVVKRYTSGAYGVKLTVRSGLNAGSPAYPCLAQLDDGRILCFYWTISGTSAQVGVSMSRDDGATWTAYASDVLPAVISTGTYTLGRLRACVVGDQIALLARLDYAGPTYQIRHYASSEEFGRPGSLVATYDTLGGAFDMPPHAVGGHLWLCYRNSSNAVQVTRSGSAWQPFAVGSVEIALFSDSRDEVAVAVLADRFIYGYVLATAAAAIGRVAAIDTALFPNSVAVDDFVTGTGAYWFYDGLGTSTELPTDISAVFYRGQVRVAMQIATAGAGTYDDQIAALLVGGYSSVTYPQTATISGINLTSGMRIYWFPAALPTVYGWTLTGAAMNISTAPGWGRISAAAATDYYSIAPTATLGSHEIWALFRMRVVSGGSISTGAIAATVRLASGVAGYECRIQFSTTQIRMRDYDTAGGPSDLATVTVDTTAGVDVLVAVAEGKASAWYRSIGEEEDALWTEIATDQTLTDDGAAGGTANVIAFGTLTSATAVSDWRFVAQVSGSTLGTAVLSEGFTNPDDLWPAPYTTSPLYVKNGTLLSARGGPAARGDTYQIPTTARYARRLLLGREGDEAGPALSPRQAWRSTTRTGTIRAAFTFDADTETTLPRGAYAVHVERCNSWPCNVRLYTSSAWSTVASFDGRLTSLPFRRRGRKIIPNTSGSFTTRPRLDENGLAGGVFFDGVDDYVKIVSNTSGRWSELGEGPLPEILLDPDADLSGIPVTGTGQLWYPRATFVFFLAATTTAEGICLEWSSPGAVEDYVTVGSLDFGAARVLLDAVDWGTLDSQESGVTRTVFDGGGVVTYRPRTGRRSTSIPLTVLQRSTGIYQGTAIGRLSPSTTSGVGYAAEEGDVRDLILGQIREGVGRWPVVYLPSIAAGTPDQVTYAGRLAGLRGLLVTDPVDFRREAGTPTYPESRGPVVAIEEIP